jgi:hypothetical protein
MKYKHPNSRFTHSGYGDWHAFDLPMETVYEAAAEWKAQLAGIDRPWLCWHINDRWCALQQRLVQAVGWTPVVGSDPQFGPPNPVPGAVVIDFNKRFNLPILWLHVPLEFAFLFVERKLAFWHADLLCRLEVMRELATLYESLNDGEMAAVRDTGGIRYLFKPKHHRYWELAGCMTKTASRQQFELGTGWWQHFAEHPNCPDDAERRRREQHYWDSGVGIMYWKRRYGGVVKDVNRARVEEGHCTAINYKGNYTRLGPASQPVVGKEIDINYSLDDVARRLKIDHLLDPVSPATQAEAP